MFINPNKKYQQGGDVCNSGKARNSKNSSIEMPKKERERVIINFGKYSKVYSN